MNKNGFTLVELLAVVVILGILMTIAIPNTVALIDKNKKSNYIENAKTFVSLVQSKVQTDKSLQLPVDESTALVVTLKYLNTSDIEKSPYGETYDKDKSFVAIIINEGKFVYYVHLISPIKNASNSWRGINFVESSLLNEDNSFRLVKTEGIDSNMISNISANSIFSNKLIYRN